VFDTLASGELRTRGLRDEIVIDGHIHHVNQSGGWGLRRGEGETGSNTPVKVVAGEHQSELHKELRKKVREKEVGRHRISIQVGRAVGGSGILNGDREEY